MKCTCGNPLCKIGSRYKSKEERLYALIQENGKLLNIIKEQQELIQLQKLFISKLPSFKSLARGLRPLRKLR